MSHASHESTDPDWLPDFFDLLTSGARPWRYPFGPTAPMPKLQRPARVGPDTWAQATAKKRLQWLDKRASGMPPAPRASGVRDWGGASSVSLCTAPAPGTSSTPNLVATSSDRLCSESGIGDGRALRSLLTQRLGDAYPHER